MAKQAFKITKFTYPNKAQGWRVSGTLNGKQVRKNFKTRTEAKECQEQYNIRALNERDEGKTIWTTLTHDENQDAIAAVNRLKRSGSKRSLSFAVDFLIEYFNEAEREINVRDAVQEYVAMRNEDYCREVISRKQFVAIQVELNKLCEYHGDVPVNEMTPKMLTDFVKRSENKPAVSLKTINNRRGLVNAFFKFCCKEKYASQNPVEDVQQYKIQHRRGTAETLSVEQAEELMHFLETYTGPADITRPKARHEPGFLVPFFALALFAGVRPDPHDGEISKLLPAHVNGGTDTIRIEPEVSKTNEKRVVNIQPNLKRWLKRYPLPASGAVPHPNPDRILGDVRKQFKLGHDVLRHTYISMLVGRDRSVGDAALQAGNSEAVIRRHYLDVQSKEDAKRFWGIVPKVK